MILTTANVKTQTATVKKMTDSDVATSLASLADKVSHYHSRLMAVERDLEKLTKEKKEKNEVKIEDG